MEEGKRHTLMVSLSYTGHTDPSLGLMRCLIVAGHEVGYIQAETFQERAEVSGVRFMPYGKSPHSFVPVLNEIQSWGTACRTMRRVGVNCDCLIYELLFFPEKALIIELGIPCYRLISTFTLNRHLLRVFGKAGGPYLTALLRSDWLYALMSRPSLPRSSPWEEDLAEALVREVPPHSFTHTLWDFQSEEASLPATHYRFVGFTVKNRVKEASPFEESGNPIVYVSFGTLMHADKRFQKKLIGAFVSK